MRILWHSVAPWVSTGYGRVTREVAARIHQYDEHEIGIQSLASVKKDPILWHGEVWNGDGFVEEVKVEEPIPIFPSSSPSKGGPKHFGVKDIESSIHNFEPDFYFTHFDTWMRPARDIIPGLEIPYGSYIIVDHEPVPEVVKEQVMNAHETVAMSRWAKRKVEEKGVRARYIPHGVDTDKYFQMDRDNPGYPSRIDTGDSYVDLDERMVVGIVAANHADRKHIPEQMEAFNLFKERTGSNAILYIHTQQNSPSGFNLYEIQNNIGISDSDILWASEDLYHDIGDEALNMFYNSFDVMMNCTRGESWGLTITEAQSAGTPCIVNNFSAMPEQLGVELSRSNLGPTEYAHVKKAPHGLVVEPIMGIWRERVSSKQYLCRPEDISYALEYYYNNPELMEEHGERAAKYVRENYSWENNVVPLFKQMFDQVERLI